MSLRRRSLRDRDRPLGAVRLARPGLLFELGWHLVGEELAMAAVVGRVHGRRERSNGRGRRTPRRRS